MLTPIQLAGSHDSPYVRAHNSHSRGCRVAVAPRPRDAWVVRISSPVRSRERRRASAGSASGANGLAPLTVVPRPDAGQPALEERGRPRVLYVNKLYWPWTGGIETVVRHHAEGLREQFDTRVLACQPRGRGASQTVNGVPVTRAASVGMFKGMPVSPSFPFWYRQLARDADLVHLHLPFPPADISQVLLGPRDRPLVVTWHSGLVRQRVVMPVYRPFMRRLLDRASAIIVHSAAVLERSEDLAPVRDRCYVVPIGVPVPDLPLETPWMPGVDDQPVVLFAGRLAYYKGLDHLLRAMCSVNARLVIAGSGEEESRLKALAARLGIAGRVHFTEGEHECKHALFVVEQNFARHTGFHATEGQRGTGGKA